MASINIPRIVLAGVRDDSAPAWFLVGLVSELRRREVGVSCCVVGAHMQLAVILRRLCGRYVRCLDPTILSPSQILHEVHLSAAGADIVIVVGTNGLFDGDEVGSLHGSLASFSEILQCPTLLVADVRQFGNSLAALVKGYHTFYSRTPLAGLVLEGTKFGDERQKGSLDYFNTALRASGLFPALGSMPDDPTIEFTVPHGVSQKKNQTGLSRQTLVNAAASVRDNVQVDQILAIAQKAGRIDLPSWNFQPMQRRARIAVSEDVCFAPSFQNNVELIRFFGGEAKGFSPLADVRLPRDVNAIYLTGAHLFEYGSELSANQQMVDALRRFVDAGGIIYSEGAGTAYLCEKFQIDEEGELVDGVGIIPGIAQVKVGLEEYSHLILTEDTVIGPAGGELPCLVSNDWDHTKGAGTLCVAKYNSHLSGEIMEGFSPTAQSFCTFTFPNWGANPLIAKNFVDNAEAGGVIRA